MCREVLVRGGKRNQAERATRKLEADSAVVACRCDEGDVVDGGAEPDLGLNPVVDAVRARRIVRADGIDATLDVGLLDADTRLQVQHVLQLQRDRTTGTRDVGRGGESHVDQRCARWPGRHHDTTQGLAGAIDIDRHGGGCQGQSIHSDQPGHPQGPLERELAARLHRQRLVRIAQQHQAQGSIGQPQAHFARGAASGADKRGLHGGSEADLGGDQVVHAVGNIDVVWADQVLPAQHVGLLDADTALEVDEVEDLQCHRAADPDDVGRTGKFHVDAGAITPVHHDAGEARARAIDFNR